MFEGLKITPAKPARAAGVKTKAREPMTQITHKINDKDMEAAQ